MTVGGSGLSEESGESGESSLEARVRRLENVEAIRTLTATYAHSVDRGANGKHVDAGRLPSLFSEDVTWRNPAQQIDLSGRSEVVGYLADEGAVSFAQHSFTNPVIEVDGDTATATWLLWVAVNDGGTVGQVFQDEDLTYTRTADGWVISAIELHFGQFVVGQAPGG